MTVSQQLRRAAAPIWARCLNHPFVTGIGDGTLPAEKFRYFMLQDYLYLFDYARVFALGVVKARDAALMRLFAKNVDAILDGEMAVHRAYMARLGIPEARVLEAEMAPENLAYTRYMLWEAERGGPREIASAILACSWSYAEIGQALARRPGALEHPFYGQWVQSYASAEYGEANQALIALTDRLGAEASGEERARLQEIFVQCSRYELGFWDMAWEARP